MSGDPTVDPREAGTAGAAVASVAGILKHAQTLSALVPGSVPPPIAAWIENLMRTIPQIVSRQTPDTSLLSATPGAQTGAQTDAGASPQQGSMPMQPRAPSQSGAYVM